MPETSLAAAEPAPRTRLADAMERHRVLLAALFLWPSVSRVSRVLLAAYALAMALTLVYTGEHYVVDVLAGWLVAVVGVCASRGVGRRAHERDELAVGDLQVDVGESRRAVGEAHRQRSDVDGCHGQDLSCGVRAASPRPARPTSATTRDSAEAAL